MKYNSFQAFSRKFYEQTFLKEEEQKIEQKPDLVKLIEKSPKLHSTLVTLLTSQESVGDKSNKELVEIVADIKVISYKPTTFRVIFKNSNYFDLIYDPTPDEVSNKSDYQAKDYFRIAINGKRYDLSNDSDFEQAIDYISINLKTNPIDSSNPDTEQAAGDSGEAPAPAPEPDKEEDKEPDKEAK